MEEVFLGRRNEWLVWSLLLLFMVLQVADVVITEVLLHTGQGVEINPWMRTQEARWYGKPTIGLGLCAAILLVLPPQVRRPAALAAVVVAAAPFLFLGVQLLLRS